MERKGETSFERRRVLRHRLDNYRKALDRCHPAERHAWQLRLNATQAELHELDRLHPVAQPPEPHGPVRPGHPL